MLPGGASLATEYYVKPTGAKTFTLVDGNNTAQVFTSTGTGILTLLKRYSGLTPSDKAAYTSGYESQIQYAVNAVDPTGMLLGLNNLYVSHDGLDTVTRVATGTTQITALAYGGKLGATVAPTVRYAALGTSISVSYPTYSHTEKIAGVKSITSIVLDPRDYTIAYAVTDAGVYKRTAVNTWTLISAKLPSVGLQAATFIPKESLAWPTGPERSTPISSVPARDHP